MPRAKMTTGNDETQDKAAEVKEAAKGIAEDVAEKVVTPKKAKPVKTATTPRNPDLRESSSKGPNIDPSKHYPKILNLLVTVGEGDERSMEEFTADVKDALEGANTKQTTVLLSKYLIDGQHILSHAYDKAVSKGDDEAASTTSE